VDWTAKLFFLFGMPPYTTQNQRPPPQPRNELVEWYYSIPPVTRALMTAGVVVPIAPVLGIAGMHSLLLVWKPVFEKFQARLVMCIASYINAFMLISSLFHGIAMATGYVFLCSKN
jgi:hypothetical protein